MCTSAVGTEAKAEEEDDEEEEEEAEAEAVAGKQDKTSSLRCKRRPTTVQSVQMYCCHDSGSGAESTCMLPLLLLEAEAVCTAEVTAAL
jgi:hypothetical protein